jgi:hypothetical protein
MDVEEDDFESQERVEIELGERFKCMKRFIRLMLDVVQIFRFLLGFRM